MLSADRTKAWINKNLTNIYSYTGMALAVLVVYHLLSDGDFSFLMTLGSFLRMCAFVLLLIKVRSTQSAAGVSLKTLQLYALAFTCRLSSILFFDGYLPFDRSGDWFYQTVEVLALALTVTVIVMIMASYHHTYEASHDRFGVAGSIIPDQFGALWIIIPALVLALLVHPALNHFFLTDVAWTLALYVEAVAVLPQLYLFHRKGGEVESFTSHFVVCLGIARIMHFAFWFSTHHELHNHKLIVPGGIVGWVVLLSQAVQLFLMVDFLFYYVVSVRRGGPIILPTRV